MDSTVKSPYPFDRKVSFSLQLTADDEYKGCDLELGCNFMNDKLAEVMRERGTLILFPSFMAHRVTPILGGTRKALVGWCRGPNFR
jgi:PKHD-type hydroxylase